MSKRFSTKLSDGISQDVETTIELSKTNGDAQHREKNDVADDFVAEEDSFRLNEMSCDK
jgi:hypothetical protein